MSAHCSFVITCWEMADLLTLLCVMYSFVVVSLPDGVLGHMWYLIVLSSVRCLLYFYILPLVDYGPNSRGSTSITNIERITKLQKILEADIPTPSADMFQIFKQSVIYVVFLFVKLCAAFDPRALRTAKIR